MRQIARWLQWVQGGTVRLLMLAGGILLVWGTVAPVGTLVWWLQEGKAQLGLPNKSSKERSKLNSSAGSSSSTITTINCYIIYLPGVGDFSANQLTPGEEFFLTRLSQRHPNCALVTDVFPYSAANESLGGRRLLGPMWQAMENAKDDWGGANLLIKIRNLWRFAISADDRYGPIYNQGIAQAVVDRMQAAHPIPQVDRQPLNLILIGTSGGVQVSLGAATYLKQWLPVRLTIVSVGGDFDGNTGFDAVERFYHLQGEKDWVEDLSSVLFPSRWRWSVASPFNRLRQSGSYFILQSGPHEHDGDRGYFGLKQIPGQAMTYVELTLQKVDALPIWNSEVQHF